MPTLFSCLNFPLFFLNILFKRRLFCSAHSFSSEYYSIAFHPSDPILVQIAFSQLVFLLLLFLFICIFGPFEIAFKMADTFSCLFSPLLGCVGDTIEASLVCLALSPNC